MKTSDMLLLGAGLGVAAYFLVYKPVKDTEKNIASTVGTVTGAALGAEIGTKNAIEKTIQDLQLGMGSILTPDQPIVIGKTGIEPSTQTGVWDRATDYISSTVLPEPPTGSLKEALQNIVVPIPTTPTVSIPISNLTVPAIHSGTFSSSQINDMFQKTLNVGYGTTLHIGDWAIKKLDTNSFKVFGWGSN